MYRSVRFLQARSLATLPLRTTPRLPLHQTTIAFRRNLATSLVIRSDKSSGVGGKTPGRGVHNNEDQNHTPGVREELKGLQEGVASIISGASGIPEKNQSADVIQQANDVTSHLHKDDVRADLQNFREQVVKSVPKPAMVFGLAGTLPYLVTSAGTIFLAREASLTSLGKNTITGLDLDTILDALHSVEHVQITYGAVILSFLGAIHWGFEFAQLGGAQNYRRLTLGIIPVLIAWPTTFLTHELALVAQWFGFTGTWLIDQRMSTRGWTPSWYSTYRFYLSLVVGVSIMVTFAGTGYYGAGAGATGDPNANYLSTQQRISKIADRNNPSNAKIEGKVKGDIEVEEGTDSFLVLHNRKAEAEAAEEERKEQEEEKKAKQKEKAEAQDKKDEHQQDKAPGSMKSDAKDRTGKNANEEGGQEERPDEEKQKPQK